MDLAVQASAGDGGGLSLAGRDGPDAEGVEVGHAGQADAETDGSFRADVVVADGAKAESGRMVRRAGRDWGGRGAFEGLLSKGGCALLLTDDDSSGKAPPFKRNQR